MIMKQFVIYRLFRFNVFLILTTLRKCRYIEKVATVATV
jgi:hypothetical protein